MTHRPIDHPANRLTRGDIHSLPAAVTAYLAGIAVEAEIDDADGYWARERLRAVAVREIYRTGASLGWSDNKIAVALRRGGFREWSDALLSGDYTPLGF